MSFTHTDTHNVADTEQDIAIGIILNPHFDVFVAIRPEGKSYAGLFEFPGGKVEPEEDVRSALKRELMEEIGITVTELKDFGIKQSRVSESLCLNLHFFLVTQWEGEPFGKEGQKTQWIAASELVPETFPPANQDIVLKLQSEINP